MLIKAHAYGALLMRALVVPANHALLRDRMLVSAAALGNDDTIMFDTPAATGTQFYNYDAYLSLHGADRIIPEARYPRVSSSRLVPDGLVDRALAEIAA